MSTVKANPQDFANWLSARRIAEANLDLPVIAPKSVAPTRAPRSLTSGLRFAIVARRRATSQG